MGNPINIAGQRFERIVAIECIGVDKHRYNLWKCKCDCGNYIIARVHNIKNGRTMSCGCLHRDLCIKRSTKHQGSHTAEYSVWQGLKKRCLNTHDEFYRCYGGRGIKVCDRWLHSFENFLSDIGKRPEGTSIDRINNDGDYEPSNCRWATAKEQANNTRRNVKKSLLERVVNV